jgi:hypothetical protein
MFTSAERGPDLPRAVLEVGPPLCWLTLSLDSRERVAPLMVVGCARDLTLDQRVDPDPTMPHAALRMGPGFLVCAAFATRGARPDDV